MIIAKIKRDNLYSERSIASYFGSMLDDFTRYVDRSISLYKIDKYLSKLIGDNTEAVDVIRYIIPFIIASRSGNEVNLIIPDNMEYKNKNIISLLKLIDYGNMEIKGTKLFKKACNYAISQM